MQCSSYQHHSSCLTVNLFFFCFFIFFVSLNKKKRENSSLHENQWYEQTKHNVRWNTDDNLREVKIEKHEYWVGKWKHKMLLVTQLWGALERKASRKCETNKKKAASASKIVNLSLFGSLNIQWQKECFSFHHLLLRFHLIEFECWWWCMWVGGRFNRRRNLMLIDFKQFKCCQAD